MQTVILNDWKLQKEWGTNCQIIEIHQLKTSNNRQLNENCPIVKSKNSSENGSNEFTVLRLIVRKVDVRMLICTYIPSKIAICLSVNQ